MTKTITICDHCGKSAPERTDDSKGSEVKTTSETAFIGSDCTVMALVSSTVTFLRAPSGTAKLELNHGYAWADLCEACTKKLLDVINDEQ